MCNKVTRIEMGVCSVEDASRYVCEIVDDSTPLGNDMHECCRYLQDMIRTEVGYRAACILAAAVLNQQFRETSYLLKITDGGKLSLSIQNDKFVRDTMADAIGCK